MGLTTVVTWGLASPGLTLPENAWRSTLEVLEAPTAGRARDLLRGRDVAVLVIGPAVTPADAAVLLLELAGPGDRAGRGGAPVSIVLAGGEDLSPLQPLIDEDRIYYLSPRPISAGELRAIVRAAIERFSESRRDVAAGRSDALDGDRSGAARRSAGSGFGGRRAQVFLSLGRRMEEARDAGAAGRLAAAGLAELLGDQRCHCLLYDADDELLWSPDEDPGERREESAAAGLCSFALRTGEALRIERAGDDPRYDPEADNPGGEPSDRLLVAPARDRRGRALGVLVAARPAGHAPFDDGELEVAGALADLWAHALGTLSLRREVQEHLLAASGETAEDPREIFRAEALEQQRFGHGGRGRLLDLSPRWMRPLSWLFYGLVVAFLTFALVGRVSEYAEGPAVIRSEGKTELTAPAGGLVDRVLVEPGRRVERGEILLRFYDAAERADLDRATREFELRLIELLKAPGDEAVRRSLAALRTEQDRAAARLAERVVRAPHDGVVRDLLVRPGQHTAPGERLIALAGSESAYTVTALLPGQFLPQISAEGGLRLEIRGYEHVFHDLEVTQVGDEVIGPAEVRRFLGPQLGDALIPGGPVVLVKARLPGDGFRFRSRDYRFHDGMIGTARQRLRSESILVSLIPALRRVGEDDHGG